MFDNQNDIGIIDINTNNNVEICSYGDSVRFIINDKKIMELTNNKVKIFGKLEIDESTKGVSINDVDDIIGSLKKIVKGERL